MPLSDSTPAPDLRIAMIGAGALGSALGRRLHERGFNIQAVISRSPENAYKLAETIHAPVSSAHLDDLPTDINFIFCCVPDAVIRDVARQIAGLRRPWRDVAVAHTSGAHTASALSPLNEQGAFLLSFHPLQTFPPGSSSMAFEDIYIGLEGAPEAIEIGNYVAEAIGGRPIVIPTEAKALYHLAGSMASNFAVTLAALVSDVLASAGISHEQGRDMLAPLVISTLQNLRNASPEESLTGPIVRGDTATVAAHVSALHTHIPSLVPVYTALASATIDVAVRSGRLSADCAAPVRQVLNLPAPGGDLR